jgi:hypothetical protein
MGNRMPEICAAIADQLRTIVPIVSYPAPSALNTKQPHAVVFGGSGTPGYGGDTMQEWLQTIRVTIFVAPITTPAAMGKLDEYLDEIRDLFSPRNRAAYFLEETGSVPRVDFCQFASFEVSGTIEYAGQPYYAGALEFAIKRHRFDGAE